MNAPPGLVNAGPANPGRDMPELVTSRGPFGGYPDNGLSLFLEKPL